MQQLNVLPSIKTSLVAAAVTVATLALANGSASASSMHETQKHGNAHTVTQHDDKSNHKVKKEKKQEQSQAAIDLRVGLNNLLRDHVTSNLDVNRSIADGASQAEIDAGMENQIANSDALAAAIGSIYGPDAQAQFSEMFREHIVESNNYAVAVAAGDEAAKEAANEELKEYLEEIATFFSTAIPVLPYDAVYALLSEHEELINQSTEAFKAENYAESFRLERAALTQVSGIADALANGIISTQPDKF